MNPQIDFYLSEGCGRCPLGGTPDCKVHLWTQELVELRRILLECGLTEELKWSVPCYTLEGKNVALLSAFKDYLAIGFFKGALLKDPHGMLTSPGKNSQSDRRLQFTDVKIILEQEKIIKGYIQNAIEVEKAGLKVSFKKNPEPMPEELEEILSKSPDLKAAFEALSPGRQRGYILYFSAPKQAKTRYSRIEKYTSKILAGKGFHER